MDQITHNHTMYNFKRIATKAACLSFAACMLALASCSNSDSTGTNNNNNNNNGGGSNDDGVYFVEGTFNGTFHRFENGKDGYVMTTTDESQQPDPNNFYYAERVNFSKYNGSVRDTISPNIDFYFVRHTDAALSTADQDSLFKSFLQNPPSIEYATWTGFIDQAADGLVIKYHENGKLYSSDFKGQNKSQGDSLTITTVQQAVTSSTLSGQYNIRGNFSAWLFDGIDLHQTTPFTISGAKFSMRASTN